MLGLGNGLTKSGLAKLNLITYSSDFSSNVDGWLKYSVDQGDMTITANQNPNSDGGPDESGWLKAVWDSNQTSASGIRSANLHSNGILPTDTFSLSYRIFMKNDDGQFIGSDDISFRTTITDDTASHQTQHTDIAGDEVVSISIAQTTIGGGSNNDTNVYVNIQWSQSTGDYAQAGAVIYLKDFTITHIR